MTSHVFFSRLVGELQSISSPNPVIMVRNFADNYVEMEENFCLSQGNTLPLATDDGLIDLQTFDHIRNEVESIAMRIIEGNQDD